MSNYNLNAIDISKRPRDDSIEDYSGDNDRANKHSKSNPYLSFLTCIKNRSEYLQAKVYYDDYYYLGVFYSILIHFTVFRSLIGGKGCHKSARNGKRSAPSILKLNQRASI